MTLTYRGQKYTQNNAAADTDSRPYDRHRYRVIFTDGSIQDVASYAEATDLWYVDRRKARLIEVLPAKKQGGRPGRSGFG